MDILRKMFQMKQDEAAQSGDNGNKDALPKDDFRKPQWFEEVETDDELFGDDSKFAFQVFTNPLELQKHFEQQMEQIMAAVSQMENEGEMPVRDKNLKEEYMKPGFEENFIKDFGKQRSSLFDTDLDGEIYADQLHSLMQRLNTGEATAAGMLPSNDNKVNRMLQPKKKKLSDEETIMGKIHGTLLDEEAMVRQQPMQKQRSAGLLPPAAGTRTMTPFGGVFEGAQHGPKIFRQSISSSTVRKPDGTYETTKIVQDTEGNKTTTITRTINGKQETVTQYEGPNYNSRSAARIGAVEAEPELQSDRNIYVTKQGYALPRNLW